MEPKVKCQDVNAITYNALTVYKRRRKLGICFLKKKKNMKFIATTNERYPNTIYGLNEELEVSQKF